MSEPKRWIDEEPSPVIERLLVAAAAERPSEASLPRLLAGLGVGAGTASALGTAAASGATASGGAATGAAATTAVAGSMATATKLSTVSAALALKWTLLGAAALGGAGAGIQLARRGDAPVVAPTASSKVTLDGPARAPAEPPRAAAAQPVSVPSALPPAVGGPPRTARALPSEISAAGSAARVEVDAPPVNAERLAEEVRAVDLARALASSGRAQEALATLDDYERSFANRRFAPEALYLRMEALLTLGQRAAAQDVARRLVRAFPNSPQAPRARQVLDVTNP